MVLVQSAPQSPTFRFQPNPSRIFGIAGAVALNAAVLMALMLPMELPLPKIGLDTIQVVDLPQRIDPPPAPPVVQVQPRTPTPRPELQPRTVTPPVDVPPVVTQESSPVDMPYVPPTVDTPPAGETGTLDTAPVAGVRLEYASAPAPKYPREEMLAGRQGTVLLQILVDVDGKPLEVKIHQSSGNRELDRAAQRHVQKSWTFRPAMKEGRAIQAIGIVPIEFKLQ